MINIINGEEIRMFRIFIIEWEDASVQHGPLHLDDIAPQCPHIASGFLVKEDDQYITIGLDYDHNNDLWRYLLHIPQSQIKRKDELFSDRE